MSEVWFTSDTHFGHKNIIKYCDRPYKDVNHMTEMLVRNWNSCVAPEDYVWFLGDAVMGNREETLQTLKRLNGHKDLIFGNHDYCWEGGHPKKWETYLPLYAQHFDTMARGATIDIAGEWVDLCHFPFAGDSGNMDRFPEYRPDNHGQWLLHGHMHDAWKVKGRQINVGVDVWDYSPVHIDQISAIIQGGQSV